MSPTESLRLRVSALKALAYIDSLDPEQLPEDIKITEFPDVDRSERLRRRSCLFAEIAANLNAAAAQRSISDDVKLNIMVRIEQAHPTAEGAIAEALEDCLQAIADMPDRYVEQNPRAQAALEDRQL